MVCRRCNGARDTQHSGKVGQSNDIIVFMNKEWVLVVPGGWGEGEHRERERERERSKRVLRGIRC